MKRLLVVLALLASGCSTTGALGTSAGEILKGTGSVLSAAGQISTTLGTAVVSDCTSPIQVIVDTLFPGGAKKDEKAAAPAPAPAAAPAPEATAPAEPAK